MSVFLPYSLFLSTPFSCSFIFYFLLYRLSPSFFPFSPSRPLSSRTTYLLPFFLLFLRLFPFTPFTVLLFFVCSSIHILHRFTVFPSPRIPSHFPCSPLHTSLVASPSFTPFLLHNVMDVFVSELPRCRASRRQLDIWTTQKRPSGGVFSAGRRNTSSGRRNSQPDICEQEMRAE